MIRPSDWFRQSFGIDETEFKYSLDDIPDNIRSKMGVFTTISIADLTDNLETLPVQEDEPTLLVRYRSDWSCEENFDTSSLQFHAEDNTLFQVASNFNCLEVAHERTDPFSGSFLTGLMTDSTQGPSAAGGAAYGATLRLIMHNERDINLLRDTPLQPKNGKLRYSAQYPEPDPDSIMIGLHTGVQANFLRTGYWTEYNPDGPKINQVYTSTCICPNGKANSLSKVLLTAAYTGTYLAAAISRSPRVVLTLIGGGVFNNSLKLICECIADSHRKYAKYLVKGCKVELPIYEPNPTAILSFISAEELKCSFLLQNSLS